MAQLVRRNSKSVLAYMHTISLLVHQICYLETEKKKCECFTTYTKEVAVLMLTTALRCKGTHFHPSRGHAKEDYSVLIATVASL